MIDKRVNTVEAALDGLGDGASILVSGFGGAGVPFALLRALEENGANDLTLIRGAAGLEGDLFGRPQPGSGHVQLRAAMA